MNIVPRKPYRILTGDVREMLRTLPDESVHCVVTSPPYWGLRDYGIEGQLGLEPTIELYVEYIVEVFRDVRRVLRKDGTFWLNMGDCYTAGTMSGKAGPNSTVRAIGQRDTILPARKPPHGLKPKDLVGQPWRVAFALQADGWYLRSDIVWSKCLSGGTRLYARTQKGEMPSTLKDLARLRPETVQLWNGQNWSYVVSWGRVRRPRHPIEIVLRSGERVGCTGEHRWPTQRGIVRADDLRVGDILRSSRLPKPESSTSPSALHAQEIGWFVGMYIAEGSSGKNGAVLQFASHEKELERFTKLGRIAAAYGGTVRVHHTGGHAATCNIYGPVLRGILQQYVSGRTAKDKHLHPRCWARSNKFLFALLQGYLEGDGHHQKNEWRLSFTQNDALAADLRVIGARLGLSVRLKRTVHRIGEDAYPGWRGSIRETKHRRTSDNEIVSIGLSRARQFWDIQVSDQPHTFALASGVLTHNSNPMPESCTDRPTKSHEYVFMLTKAAKYFFDQEAVKEAATYAGKVVTLGPKSLSRGQATGMGVKPSGNANAASVTVGSGHNIRSVWTIPTQAFPEAHFATFPEALPERCIKAGTSERGCCPKCGAPWVRVMEKSRTFESGSGKSGNDPSGKNGPDLQGGGETGDVRRRPCVHSTTTGWQPSCEHERDPVPCTVLDPFVGSGTTALVAVRLGRRAIGIDLSAKYTDMVEKQLAVAARGGSRRPRKFRLKGRKKIRRRIE